MDSRLPCGGSLQRSTSLTNRARVVPPVHHELIGRTIPLSGFIGISQKPALRTARQPTPSVESDCLAYLLWSSPIRNATGGVSRKRSPVLEPRPLQVAKKSKIGASLGAPLRVSHPRKDGPRAYARGPTDAERARAVHRPNGGYSNDPGPGDRRTRVGRRGRRFHQRSLLGARLASPLAWATPQYSRWEQMQLLRARQASVAAGAKVMTMAWEATTNGHDVDLAVGAGLEAHAHLRPGEHARVSWESRPSRHRPAPSRRVQDGKIQRDRHHGQCSFGACSFLASCTASPLEPPHWRAGSLLASFFTETLPSSESKRRVTHQISACSEPLQRIARLCVVALPDALVRFRPRLHPPTPPHK